MSKQTTATISVKETLEEYLHRADWRVQANSNQGYSLGGMILNTSGKATANYWLHHVYPKEVGQAHTEGDIHIHDLDMFAGYCAGWSLRALLEEGFNGVADKIECSPPKNLAGAVGQMVNFLGTLQNEWAGAQAFSSFDTYLAPYVKRYELGIREEITSSEALFPSEQKKETYIYNRVYKYVYDCIQTFVFNLNIPSRWGSQTPFTNITMDITCPPDLKEKHLKLGGEYFPLAFGELQQQMDMINSAYIDVIVKGDKNGRVFTFPIPTYNITPDFPWDHPNTEKLFLMTAKYGLPYFQNFLNSDLTPQQVRSMCCRLQLDLSLLLKRGNGLFGSAELTGSIGVVTINAARIGYLFRGNKQGYLDHLINLMELAKQSLELKRSVITHWMDMGLFPFTKRYLHTLGNHFSTIGINGLHESVKNFFQGSEDITTKKGGDFAEEVLIAMREKLVTFQEETGNLYNLEASPAEGATYRFAKEDKKRFPDIFQSGTDEYPYYTNSSQLPVEYTSDIFEELEHQDRFQTKYTGGTVLHIYLGERVSSSEACKRLVKTVLSNFRLPYITLSPTFSICPSHGYVEGEHDFCPRCDKELGYTEETSTICEETRKPHISETKRHLSIH